MLLSKSVHSNRVSILGVGTSRLTLEWLLISETPGPVARRPALLEIWRKEKTSKFTYYMSSIAAVEHV
jgi:hypothetical protein